jgi:hypothetical protein
MSRPTSQKYLSLKDLNVSCPWAKGIHYMFNNKSQNLPQKNVNIKMGSIYVGLNCSLQAFFFQVAIASWNKVVSKIKKIMLKHLDTQI